jgi:hypothetical protein
MPVNAPNIATMVGFCFAKVAKTIPNFLKSWAGNVKGLGFRLHGE